MNNMSKSLILSMAIGLLALQGVSFAQGKDPRGGHVDAQMKKFHAMMPMFSMASAELESALEKGEAGAAKVQADRILAAVPDLKKSKPHKNVKQRKKFVELATNLERTLISTVDLVKEGNFVGAKAAFKKVEEVCSTCHAKFRD